MTPFITSISSKLITRRRKIIKCWSRGKSCSCGAVNGACGEQMTATNDALSADEWRAGRDPLAAEERIASWLSDYVLMVTQITAVHLFQSIVNKYRAKFCEKRSFVSWPYHLYKNERNFVRGGNFPQEYVKEMSSQSTVRKLVLGLFPAGIFPAGLFPALFLPARSFPCRSFPR